MTGFRTHLDFLVKTDDLLALDRPTVSPQVVAAEALRANGPALRFRPGEGDGVALASGVYGGTDQLARRARYPWTRLGIGFGIDRDPDYVAVLDALVGLGERTDPHDVTYVQRAASTTDLTMRDLDLPQPPDAAWPRFTLGLASVRVAGGTCWAPIHGSVLDGETVRARVPQGLVDRLSQGDAVTVALGVPPEALAATYLLAVTDRLADPVQERAVAAEVPLVPTAGGVVPSASEVVVEAAVAGQQPETAAETGECWERLVDSTTLTLDVTDVFAREDAVVPFTPLGAPLGDDLQLTALARAARLFERANSYWGISPVAWLLLPAETRLGTCFVASDVLYAGFEWQLANFLFSVSESFDKVVVVDADVSPRNLGQVLADIWIKAHPARDWLFSESDAPAARMPTYRADRDTGARLYVDTTWDPRWQEEYVAPRVSFTESYPTEVREAVRESWADFGFATPPDEVP